jgi:hypothetical protein
MFSASIHGFDQVKRALADIERSLTAAQVRGVLDEPGRVMVQEAKNTNPFTGELGAVLNKDLGVYRDRRKASRHAEYVIVGPRYKRYTIRGKEATPALIAQHATVGFRQTDRYTRAGQRRGRVGTRYENFMKETFTRSRPRVQAAIEEGLVKVAKKIKARNRGVLV